MLAIAAGGGLAGAAFALEVVRCGGRAMIVEKSAGPHHKVCGEFLSENAALLLGHLGVDCDRLGCSKVETLRLADGASQVTAPLPFQGRGLSRFRLDEALLAAAQAAGVEVLPRDRRRRDCRGRRWRSRAHERWRIARRTAVALASGKHNVRGFSRPGGSMVGFKTHVNPSAAARQSMSGIVQLHAFPGGYGGFCLVEDGLLSIAWNIHSDVLRVGRLELGGAIGVSCQELPRVRRLIDGAEAAWSKPLAVSGQPYGFLRSAPVGASIYPVGDQLAVIPSFVGDGTALALASGIAAARAVLGGESAHEFQARIVSGHKPQFRHRRRARFHHLQYATAETCAGRRAPGAGPRHVLIAASRLARI